MFMATVMIVEDALEAWIEFYSWMLSTPPNPHLASIHCLPVGLWIPSSYVDFYEYDFFSNTRVRVPREVFRIFFHFLPSMVSLSCVVFSFQHVLSIVSPALPSNTTHYFIHIKYTQLYSNN
jgi:hypothetical protein